MSQAREDFEALWEKATKEPEVRKVLATREVRFELPLDEIAERYIAHARQKVETDKGAGKQVDKSALQELDSVADTIAGLKASLSKLDRGDLFRGLFDKKKS